MKLGNHGWGIKELIIYLCILLSFLLVAMYFINSLYNSIETSKKDYEKENNEIYENNSNKIDESTNEIIEENKIDISYYENLEQDLYNATLNYFLNGEINEDTKYISVNIKTLINKGYIDSLIDKNNNTCEGYSNIAIDTTNDYDIKSYIKCSEYTTSGY